MYKILITDNTNNTQYSENEYIYLTEAREGCIYLATEFILKFQGSSYLNKLFYEKDKIRKGYALVKKDTPVYTKITVYYKEPNGYLYKGQLKKIRTFITINLGTNYKKAGHLVNYEPEFEEYGNFDKVLAEISLKFNKSEN